MNEQVARDVLLARAIETTDVKREILSDDDRLYASRSARELAQWQASDSRSAVTFDHFLQQRSEQILKRISVRVPVFATLIRRRNSMRLLYAVLPVIALMLGAGLDRISDPHRVDLLSAPLLGIIGWNLLVYLALLALLVIPRRWRPRSSTGWIGSAARALPRKLPQVLAAAATHFLLDWGQLSAPLNAARLRRTMHLSALAFAVGAMLSLYWRGLMTQYMAGWESTFLDAEQVHAILSSLFAPAVAVFGLQGFSLTEIEALHFSNPQAGAGGARWVHLYAASLFLLVVLPRALMAGLAHLKARKLERRFPIDLDQPYFRQLSGAMGCATPAFLRVLPYSFDIDEARDRGLAVLATTLLGEQAKVMRRPPLAYGEEPAQWLSELALDDPAIAVTAVLFNLAATPEKENHGVFLDYLVRHARCGIAVLVDESALKERSGAQRTAERIALWQQFCDHHRAPMTVVNLLQPTLYPLDPARGLDVSKAP